MGTCTLLTFVIVVYGVYDGRLGSDCNRTYQTDNYESSCEPVFRARAAVFAELTWLILISAWEFKSIRRSMFRLDPASNSRFPFFKDVFENRFLFWAVLIGALSVFPSVYIPYLNTRVFKMVGITWEWGLAFGSIFVFVFGIEMWKWLKRSKGWFEVGDEEEEKGGRKLGLRQGFFTMSKRRSTGSLSGRTLGRRSTDVSIGEKITDMGTLSATPTTRSLLKKEDPKLGGKEPESMV